MKKSSLTISLLLLSVAAGITGCSTHVLSDDNEPLSPVEGKNLNIRIHSNDFTRAGDDGISRLYLALYKSGNSKKLISLAEATLAEDGETYSIQLPADPMTQPDMVVAYANFPSVEAVNEAIYGGTVSDLSTDGSLIMSNAAYFEGAENQTRLINYSVITPENLSSGTPVDVYLERIAAKVTVKETDPHEYADIVVRDKDGNDLTLKLNIDNWGVNATDNSTYLHKELPPFNEVATLFDEGYLWNDASKRTIHWAQSLNYDELKEGAVNKITFKEINTDLISSVYTHETTRQENVSGADSKPYVVITGHYLNGDSYMPTFYRLRSSGKDIIYKSDEEYFASLASSQDLIYVKNGENQVIADEAKIKEVLSLATPANKGVTDNYVSPQLKSDPSDLVNSDGESWTKEALDNALHKRYGVVEKYAGGKCVFMVPIVHYKGQNTLHGLVRNHSYTLTIKNISGFGRGVGGPESPITDAQTEGISDSYKINASYHVIGWTEAEQDIIIK